MQEPDGWKHIRTEAQVNSEEEQRFRIFMTANHIETILYEMYSTSEFAPGDPLMTFVAQVAPSGWVDQCCQGAARTQKENAIAYMEGKKTKEQLIDALTLGKVMPLVIAEIVELANEVITRGEKK